METIERRSESPLSKTRSSSRLSNYSNQDLSDDSDTALIEHVKAIKRSRRGSKKKEKENGNIQLDENGTEDQIRTNGTHSPEPGEVLSNPLETEKEPPIVVMEISQDANNDVGDDGEMIDLEIEEADDNVDVDDDDDSTADKIVITTSEDVINTDGETVEIKVSEVTNAKTDEEERNEEIARDEREKTPGMTEEEVDQDFDVDERSGKSLNDTENGDDRWSVTVNIDATDQKDLLETQVAPEVTEKENEPANNSFTNKISNLLGSWSPIRNQEDPTVSATKGPVYYTRISGRPGLKSGTPDRNIPGPSKEPVTPSLTRFLDDSFRVRSEPAKVNRKEVVDQPNLKKYRGKRCLNTDEADEAEEGFFARLSFRKRRKLNDSEVSTSSSFFGNLFRSPFKKRSVADVRPNESQSSEFKLSWLLTPFAFGKKKDAESDADVSTAEIAQESQESTAAAAAPAPTTSEVEKTDENDKPVGTKENGGCLIM